MTRGILVTAYMRPAPRVAFEQIERAYIDLCARHAFLRYSAVQPATKHVAGSNVAAMHVEAQDGVVVVTVAIDNLLKGAAGQAVQDFNLRFGFDEAAGLTAAARWP